MENEQNRALSSVAPPQSQASPLTAENSPRPPHTPRRGPLQVGEKVQLQAANGELYTVTLSEQGWFNSRKATFPLSWLIGASEGSLVRSREGREFLVFRPRRADYVLSMPRGAAIIYPKDNAQIVQHADIGEGQRVFECGVGSGALSLNLLTAVGLRGRVYSLEARADFADIARANVELWFGAAHPAWKLQVGKLGEYPLEDILAEGPFDRAVLDMLDPWTFLPEIRGLLRPGGVLCCYVTTVTQISTLVESLVQSGAFSTPEVLETLQRTWHVDGLSVRPDHSMVGHTGFLVVSRLLAPGAHLPRRLGDIPASEREATGVCLSSVGGQWGPEDDWSEGISGRRQGSKRKVRKVREEVVARAEYWLRGGGSEPAEPYVSRLGLRECESGAGAGVNVAREEEK